MQNLSAADFYKPTPFNTDTKNQIWMSQISDSHDNFCHCQSPFAHLLASIFPPGHKDRDLTINQILQRDYLQQCHSGGAAEAAGGDHADKPTKEKDFKGPDAGDTDIKQEDLEELFAAATEEEEEDRR